MLEHREYNTIHGIWKYGTVSDKQFETDNNIIIILTLEGYLNFISSNIINKENIVPIYIDLDDGKRLSRALSRERNQKEPKYEELCRRFLADSKDFSEDKLQAAGINSRFENDIFLKCVKEIKNYIISFN
jgi:guanylate kinase